MKTCFVTLAFLLLGLLSLHPSPAASPPQFSQLPSQMPQGASGTNCANASGCAALSVPCTNAPVEIHATGIPSMNTLDDNYRLAIGDKLSFRIEEDKLSFRIEEQREHKQLIVTDSGDLEVPYLGRFPAENKTCKQLAFELKAALEKEYFYQATVVLAVDLRTKSRGRVYLVGPVRLPGPQEIPSDEVFTLGKAILRAGGFKDFADKHNVKVTRKAGPGPSENKTIVVDVQRVFDKGKTELDLPLQPGDLIYIPERLVRF